MSQKHKPQSAAPEIESLWKIQLEKAGDQTVINQRFYADIEGAVRIATEMGNRMSGKPQSDSPPTGKSQASVTPKSSSNPTGTAPTRRTARGAKPVAPKEDNTIESTVDDPLEDALGKLMGLAFFSTIKLRFVLHAPKKITETNADIVLDEKTAVWNASFGAFLKEKKPIEMKLIY
jgi:hypothetical protein